MLPDNAYIKMIDAKLDEEIERVREEKAAKCGGFEKRFC